MRSCSLAVLYSLIAICLVGIIVAILGNYQLGIFFADMLNKKLILVDSDATQKWAANPTESILSFRFFNLTNANELYEDDFIPNVTEVGPYRYKQVKTIRLGNWSENGTQLNMTTLKQFYLDSEESQLADNVTLVNVPLVSLLSALPRRLDGLRLRAMNALLSTLFKQNDVSIVRTENVSSLLFDGYPVPVMHQFMSVSAKLDDTVEVPKHGRWGFMYEKNNTDGGNLTIWTGKDDMDKFGYIFRESNVTKHSCWRGDYCNKIRGTEGVRFRPNFDENRIAEVYIAQLFRSVPMKYIGKEQVHGIPVNRYQIPEDGFRTDWPKAPLPKGVNESQREDNSCYCVDPKKKIYNLTMCELNGLVDISECRKKLPIIMSSPHYLNGDPRILNYVYGLNPSPENHNSYIDIDPNTGIVLRGVKRIQMSLHMKNTPSQKFLRDIKNDVLIPIFWIEESGSLTEDRAEKYKEAFYAKISMLKMALLAIFVISVIVLIASFVMLLITRLRTSSGKKIKDKNLDEYKNGNEFKYNKRYVNGGDPANNNNEFTKEEAENL